MSINAIPTHKDADSYTTLAEANDYFTSFYYGPNSWANASNANKELALRQATRIIDRCRFFHEKYDGEHQRLEFPRSDEENWNGKAFSGSITTLIDTNLISTSNSELYPDDYWNGGCLYITSGTNKFEKRLISDFDRATGKITVSSAFTSAIDNTCEYTIVKKIPQEIKDAQCEIALWLLDGKNKSGRAQLQAEGIKSYSIGDLSETFDVGGQSIAMPKEAYDLLEMFICRTGVF